MTDGPDLALTRIALANFRNYSSLRLDLDRRHVCLFGQNGSGKTNLIEAVSQLGAGRGLRSSPIGDLAQLSAGQPTGNWAIQINLMQDDYERAIRIDCVNETPSRFKRQFMIDGASSSPSDLAENVRLIWLIPAMDRIFAGGASERRKFLDRQTLAHYPAHGRAASTYEKAMRERNAVLEHHSPDPVWLDGLEARMAEAGATLIQHRKSAVTRMQSAIDQRPEGAFPKADLTYETGELDINDNAAVQDNLIGALKDGRRRDKAAGRTLTGPHRHDLGVIHRPTSNPASLCSTGQQKALLIGLILANARALEQDGGASPIVLLDEAAAHLDADRRAALFDELSALSGQAWLTGTERVLFEAFGDRSQYVQIDQGNAERVE